MSSCSVVDNQVRVRNANQHPDIECCANGAFRHENDHDRKIVCCSSREARTADFGENVWK
jgi:hypothetical protein